MGPPRHRRIDTDCVPNRCPYRLCPYRLSPARIGCGRSPTAQFPVDVTARRLRACWTPVPAGRVAGDDVPAARQLVCPGLVVGRPGCRSPPARIVTTRLVPTGRLPSAGAATADLDDSDLDASAPPAAQIVAASLSLSASSGRDGPYGSRGSGVSWGPAAAAAAPVAGQQIAAPPPALCRVPRRRR